MPASANQYRQVINSYLTRPGLRRLVVPSFVAWALWLSIFDVSMRYFSMMATIRLGLLSVAFLFFLLPMVTLLVYTILVASHVRLQLSDSYAFVTPGLRRPILRVAAIAFLLGPITSVAVMLLTNWLLGVRNVYPPALLAIALTIVTPTAWWASWRSPWMALLTPLVFIVLMVFTSVGQFMLDLWNGSLHITAIREFPLTAGISSALIIGVNLLLLFALYVRVKRFTPESLPTTLALPEHQSPVSMPTQLIRHEPIITAMARIWHRRRGVLDPGAPWAVAILLTVLLVGFKLIHGGSGYDLLISLLLPVCIPGAIVSMVWREGLMNIQVESLYPASRRMFVNELLGAAALSLAEMWITTLLAALTPIFIWHQQIAEHIPLIAAVVIASALMQMLVFGVMLLASLHSGSAVLYANFVTVIAVIVPVVSTFGPRPSLTLSGLMAVAVVEMATGVFLTLLGTTAWRRADLA